MTLPAVPEDEYRRIRLRSLPDYEPEDAGRRWSSLRPATGPQLRLVPPPGEPRVPPAALLRVMRHVLEVLDGRRSVTQLRTLLPDDAFESVLTRLRTAGPGNRHALRSMRTCYPVPTAVEVAIVIDHRAPSGLERVLAAAARFERATDEWLCKVLRLL
jgi:hypothetical protein